MTSAIDSTSVGVPTRVWHFLRGPRFIDLPIRVLALIMGLTIFVPGAFEVTEPRYSGLLIVAYVLIVGAAFVPLATVIATTGLGIYFTLLYPDLQNMFPEALLLAIAVLISRRRWIGFTLGTAGLAGYLGFSTWAGSYDAGFPGITDLGYGWLTYSILGLCASFVEARIRHEIDRRERAAVDHQRSLDAMRTRFTSDMHDTISHSLTTESAIIRTLATATDPAQADRLTAELALVNAEATKRLRQLVRSLSTWEAENCTEDARPARVRFRTEAEQLSNAIEDGCAAGSVPLSVESTPLPTYSSDTLAHHFRAIMLELATNVIRHSTPGTPARLSVEMRDGLGDSVELVCRSSNESPAEVTVVPRSLSRRAEAVGGRCEVSRDKEKRTLVEVALPVRFMPSAAAAGSADMIDVLDAQSENSGATGSEAAIENQPETAGGTRPETVGEPTLPAGASTNDSTGSSTDSAAESAVSAHDRDRVSS